MRKYIKRAVYFLLILMTASSCKDEENAFQPPVGMEAFSFKPAPGGAVMHYNFPADKDLMGLNIRYKDYAGKEILRNASALSDSMVLEGFNAAQQNVPAEVRLVKRNGEESEPIAVSFSTLDSAPYAFFDNVKVLSGWNGFSVITDNNSANAKGLAHIYYLGVDPLSHQPDTILLTSFNITEGTDTLNFELKQKSDMNTIIIRTEDYRGYMVREKTWDKVASYNTVKMNPAHYDFYCDKSIEDEKYDLGTKYLFDGDLKGMTYYRNSEKIGRKPACEKLDFFLAGPEAWGEPMYVDMHKNTITSEVRLYCPLNLNRVWTRESSNPYYTLFRQDHYVDKLPCDVDVYAAKDDQGTASNWNAKQWVKVSSYKQTPKTESSRRWCAKAIGAKNFIRLETDLAAADSVYMPLKLVCEGQENGYRYLKIVVNNTYDDLDDWEFGPLNTAKYYMIQEMEIWTKKED